MKQLLTSAGFLALGAAALHAYDPLLTRQATGRPWSVSATVRGFYDDNINTQPDRLKENSGGIEVSPSVSVNLPMEQTFVSLGYTYGLKWYEDRSPHDTDQSHIFDGKLRHQFNPRHDINIEDSFVLSDEPTVAESNGIITSPTRTESSILHNRGSIEDNFSLSQNIGLSFGYMNHWYDYEQENVPGGFGSRSALLDRLEHYIRGDFRYAFNPTLVGVVGYTFNLNNYTGDELISPGVKSSIRDSYSHFGYVGADYDITAQLRLTGRAGIQYTDYHEANESETNPYIDIAATYKYLPGSTVQVGIRHIRNATDVSAVDLKGQPTLDAETTALYAIVSHRITPAFTGSLIGQYQNSTFNGGRNDDDSEDLWLVGVNFEYRFSQHWSADAGYNYDKLSSDIANRGYDRNRVYLGVRATY